MTQDIKTNNAAVISIITHNKISASMVFKSQRGVRIPPLFGSQSKHHYQQYYDRTMLWTCVSSIGHVNNIPTMQYFWNSQRHSVELWGYDWLSLLSQHKMMHCGKVVNIPY